MNRQELEERLKEIEEKYNEDKLNLLKRYADDHCSIKIGDVITDHYHTIKVEKKDFYQVFNDPVLSFVFYGTEVKKDGTPKKKPSNALVYQRNVKFVNGEEYKENKL